MVAIIRSLGQIIIVFFVIMAFMTTILDFLGRFGYIPDLGYQNFAINLVAWVVGIGLIVFYVLLAIVEIPLGFLGIDLVGYYSFDLGTLGILILEAILVLFIFVGLTTIEAMILIPEFGTYFILILPLDLVMGIEISGVSLNDVPVISELWNGWTPIFIDAQTQVHIPGLKSILGLGATSKPAIVTVLGINFQQTLNVWTLLIGLINAIMANLGFSTEYLGEIQDEVGIVFVLDVVRGFGIDPDELVNIF